MKTNIGIVTTDEERKKIAEALGIKGMVSRKDLSAELQNYVAQLIKGVSHDSNVDKNDTSTGDRVPDLVSSESQSDERPAKRHAGEDGFTPSRGDEPYIYKAKNAALKGVCSQMLDLAEDIERMTWEILEENRKNK